MKLKLIDFYSIYNFDTLFIIFLYHCQYHQLFLLNLHKFKKLLLYEQINFDQ